MVSLKIFGAAAAGIEVDEGGIGYRAVTGNNPAGTVNGVPIFSISGKGTGGTANITIDADGKVTGVTLQVTDLDMSLVKWLVLLLPALVVIQ